MADERERLRNADWIITIDEGTFGGLSSGKIAVLTPEQREQLDEGAEPDQLDTNVEAYDLEDLLKWAIDNGFFDEPHNAERRADILNE